MAFGLRELGNFNHNAKRSLQDLLHCHFLDRTGIGGVGQCRRHLRESLDKNSTHRLCKSGERFGRIHDNVDERIDVFLEKLKYAFVAFTFTDRFVVRDDVPIHDEVGEKVPHLLLRGGKAHCGIEPVYRLRRLAFGENHLSVQLLDARTRHGCMKIADFFACENVIARVA